MRGWLAFVAVGWWVGCGTTGLQGVPSDATSDATTESEDPAIERRGVCWEIWEIPWCHNASLDHLSRCGGTHPFCCDLMSGTDLGALCCCEDSEDCGGRWTLSDGPLDCWEAPQTDHETDCLSAEVDCPVESPYCCIMDYYGVGPRVCSDHELVGWLECTRSP